MDILNTKIKSILTEKNTKILPGNIKSGVNILGISGNVTELNGETKTVTPTTSQQTITPTETGKNALTQVTVNAVTSAIDNNIQAGNIKKDITILGVTGTYEGGGTQTITKMSDLNVALKNMTDAFIDYAENIQDSYNTLTNDAVTLYTPNTNYKFYAIQKRSSGKYRVDWFNRPRKIDDINIYPFISKYDFPNYNNKVLPLYPSYYLTSEEKDYVYVSPEYDSIETCIQKMKNNELTYTYMNNYLAYTTDGNAKVPISNVAIYYFVQGSAGPQNDEFMMPTRISSNETFVQI